MMSLVRKLLWNQDMTPPDVLDLVEEVDEEDDEDDEDPDLSPRMKNIIAGFEEEIEEEEDPVEKKRKEELLLRFRMQIEKPYWSDNIFMELNIENLKQCYIRAKQDLKDINSFFMITP
jgi:glutamyl/glutaminyl-tRNA synthetase